MEQKDNSRNFTYIGGQAMKQIPEILDMLEGEKRCEK